MIATTKRTSKQGGRHTSWQVFRIQCSNYW